MINNQRNNTAAMINDLRVHQAKHMTEMRSFRSGGEKQQNMKFMKQLSGNGGGFTDRLEH
jgi:hypothetical protein